MMEKYGVSLENLPPTKEQMEDLRKISKTLDENEIQKIGVPKNRQEAEDLLFNLKMKQMEDK